MFPSKNSQELMEMVKLGVQIETQDIGLSYIQ